MRRRILEPRRFPVAQTAKPELEPRDQRTVHQQIGITPDRTGEMRVSRQRETEMPDIVGMIGRLRLAAQHHLIHHLRIRLVGHASQHTIQIARMHLVPRWQRNPQPVQKAAEIGELLVGRRRMNPIHARFGQPLQFLGRRDIGQNHELLDQPVTIQTRPWQDGQHFALRTEGDFPFRQIEVQRAARNACRE